MNTSKKFRVAGDGKPRLAPDYGRVVRGLSTVELRQELRRHAGDHDYQDAVRAELARRQT